MWNLAEQTITAAELQSLADWLVVAPRLTQGEKVLQFEAAWSDWLGAAHSVMMSSGSTANFALVVAAASRVSRERPRIGVSAVTWPTNVTPSMLLGHEVVVFDVDRHTLGIDSHAACDAMERQDLDILFITHLLGLNALDETLIETAERNNVILLEDCCEAHGARMGGRRVGTCGLASTFSFYYGHHMSTIEGGMVSTDDPELADQLRLIRSHGLARESRRFEDHVARHSDIDPQFLFIEPGLNFRSTELNAVLGLSQLPALEDRIEHRNRNMRQFLDDAPDWLWTEYRTEGLSSFALPLISEDQEGAHRARRAVDDLGIERRPVVAGNLLKQPFFRHSEARVAHGGTPVADHVHSFGMYLGNGPHVSPEMVEQLTERLVQERAE